MQGTGAPKSGVICELGASGRAIEFEHQLWSSGTAQDVLLTPPQALPGQVATLNSPVLPNGNEMAGRKKWPK